MRENPPITEAIWKTHSRPLGGSLYLSAINTNNAVPTMATTGPAILSFASAALVSDTRRLAQLIGEEKDQNIAAILSRSQLLVAAAAVEAVLSEYAHQRKPNVYQDEKNFRRQGVAVKYEKLGITCPENISELWRHRNALGHSEPDNDRGLGLIHLIDVSTQIADIIEEEVIRIWGPYMPDWFRTTTGLQPKSSA